MDYKKLIILAVVTFIEAAAAFVVVTGKGEINKVVIAGCVGAGLSAVYNVVKQFIAK